MSDRSNFAVLLDLLEEELGEYGGGTRRGGCVSSSDAQRREVVERLRESTEAQLVLFLLALETRRDATDSPGELRSELRGFAAAVEDRFGVDVLRTAAEHRDRLPEVPDAMLSET